MGKRIETWKAIPGYEGLYECSDRGNVRSLDKWITVNHRTGGKRYRPGSEMFQSLKSNGYYGVSLRKAGIPKSYGVHRLVLLTFVGPPPDRADACHQNGRRADNRLVNLRWDSRTKNARDRIKHGTQVRGEHSPHSKLTETQVREIRAIGGSLEQRDTAQRYGVSQRLIWNILHGKAWAHIA